MVQHNVKQSFINHIHFFLIVVFLITSATFWREKDKLDSIQRDMEKLQQDYLALKQQVESLQKENIRAKEITPPFLPVSKPILPTPPIEKPTVQPNIPALQSALPEVLANTFRADIEIRQQQSSISWQITPHPNHLQVRSTVRQNDQLLALNVLGYIGSCKLHSLDLPVTMVVSLQDSLGNRKQVEKTWQPTKISVPPMVQYQNRIVLDEYLPNLRLSGIFQPRKGYTTDIWSLENRTGKPLQIYSPPNQLFQLSYRENPENSFVVCEEPFISDTKTLQFQIKLSGHVQGNSSYQIIFKTESNQQSIPIFFACQ